jgi:hypothetical protein
MRLKRFMEIETFINRIKNQLVNNLIYQASYLEGLISVWKNQNSIILTWEECPIGEQYNEHLYTRDDRHVFETIDELFKFLTANNVDANSFTP